MYTKKHGCNIGGRKSRLDTLRSRISGDTSKTIDRVQCISIWQMKPRISWPDLFTAKNYTMQCML